MTFLRQLTLGQYLPGDSPVHRLDPRAKLACCLLTVSAAFWPHRGSAFVATWPLLLAGLFLSRVPLGYFARGFRPFLWLFVFTLALHGLTTPGPSVWPFPLGPVDLTVRGLAAGAAVSAQLATGVAFSSLLTLTTSPTELVWALERLGAPLKRVGLPVSEFCLTMLIAIRFLPILREEAERLEKALRARGIDVGEGGLRDRFRNVTPLVVPLFRQVFSRAETLALAMEIRGYRPGVERTSWRARGLGLGEAFALGLGLATLVGALSLPDPGYTDTFRWLARAGRPGVAGRPHLDGRQPPKTVNLGDPAALALGDGFQRTGDRPARPSRPALPQEAVDFGDLGPLALQSAP